ncbi:MAG: endolytic transglycosylase MltG [Chlorobiaceae bacterium]
MTSKKTLLKKQLVIASVILMITVVCFFFLPGINTASKTTHLTIHRGMSFVRIVGELYRNQAIKNKWSTFITGRIIFQLQNIKPGRYSIPPGMSNFMLLYYLHTQKLDEVRVTLPEGINFKKAASILSKKLDFDSTGFIVAASSSHLLRKFRIKAKNVEGYLFPGTYNFAWSDSPEEVAGFLISRFRKFYSDKLKTSSVKAGLNETELLIIASIVEAETPLDREKPLVASVYFNRLKKYMRLQADPTIQYALDRTTARRLYYSDLTIDSPYNTYRYNGLPPGPICNPGSASILAVLQPADTRFLYFVATGTGGHNFSESLKEHQKNIIKYKRARTAILR